MDSAARRDDRAADVHPSGARAAGAVRAADRPHLDVATRGRAQRPGARRALEPAGAPPVRPATTAAPGKEVRVTGIGDAWSRQRRQAWEAGNRPIAAARWGSAGWHTLAWAIFGAAYVARSCSWSSGLGAPAGDVLLALAAGARLSRTSAATVGEIGFLRGIWMDGSRRLAWLEDYAASLVAQPPTSRRPRGSEGIRFEHVSFAYPGTGAWCSTT